MSRYVVIGAGAIGATVAAQLHLAGRPVVLVARGKHLHALQTSGLRYVTPTGDRLLKLPAVGGPEALTLTADDVLVLATKSQDSEALLATWAWQPVGVAAAAEAVPVVLLQNGLENARTALRRFATVLDAVVIMPSTHLEPGVVVAPGAPSPGAVYLGPAAGGRSAAADAVAADLLAAGFLVQVVPDVARFKAAKLVINVAGNVDALYPASALRSELEKGLRAEAFAALTASGTVPVSLSRDGALDLAQVTAREVAGNPRGGSSTWQSLQRGGTSEADFLSGEVVLLSRLHGLQAPLNAGVQQRLGTAARLGSAPGSLGDDDLRVLLHPVLAQPGPLGGALVLDVRWRLGETDGRAQHEAGHVPGAVFVDLETELAAAPGVEGRHPLPSVADLQAAARSWGLREGQAVVAYDDNGGMSAARAWWLLRWAGVKDVRILDGGLAAWRSAGLPLETGTTVGTPGDVTFVGGQLPVLDASAAAALAVDRMLLDARAGERFRGEVEPVDPQAGHVPGAVSAPTALNLDAQGRFLPAAQLRARFEALGVAGEVGVYCGSGVTAAHEIAALAVAGIDAALYPGSWSEWSCDPDRPVATGP